MQVRATEQTATACDGDVLMAPVFPDGELPSVTAAAAQATGLDLGAIARRFRLRHAGDRCWVPGPGTGQLGCDDVLLVCVGARGADGVARADLRAAAMQSARHAGRPRVVCSLADVPVTGGEAAELVAEAVVMGAYRFDRYQTAAAEDPRVEQVTFPGAGERSVRIGSAIGEAANLARDLTNTAPADLTPEAFAGICEDQASRFGLSYRALGIDQLREEGFGGMVGVGAGSPNPPVLACLGSGDGSCPATALVGKGITFDSGGLDVKPLSSMLQMKDDMAGAAAIVAAMTALGQIGLTPSIRAYLALAENGVSGHATRPGDVLRHRDGRTTEVISPDAEGRLVLADAISYAREQSAAKIIDVATLTGSTGLGPDLWGILGNSQPLMDALLRAGASAGEPGWQLPLWEGYRKKLRSDIADIRNMQLGVTWNHSAVWAALYLSEFTGDCDWAHLDIGATVFRTEPDETWIAGATGSGTRTLIEYLRRADDSNAAG
jgi:leucyl aminopeptidase